MITDAEFREALRRCVMHAIERRDARRRLGGPGVAGSHQEMAGRTGWQPDARLPVAPGPLREEGE